MATTMPARTEPKGDGPRRRQGSEAPRTPVTGTRLRPRVLIVDDEEDTREMYAWCMRAAGWVVETVANGEEALFLAPAFSPNVIVMDLRLPVVDGLQATRRLKADAATRDIPVLACSGVDWARAEALARQAGCDAFVAKPCLPDDLRALVEDLVGRRSSS